MSVFTGQKLVENANSQKFQMRHFEEFSNNVTVRAKSEVPQ